jgi:hypothetical protein
MTVSEDLLTRIGEDINRRKYSLKALAANTVAMKEAMIHYRKLTPLENLPEAEKKEWWEMAKELFPGKEKSELIEMCKMIYVMGNFLK